MPLITEKSSRRRAFIADTTALVLFFTTTGIINERFIAGMTWNQVFHARLYRCGADDSGCQALWYLA
ncbi:L-alanine exporter AlaE [Mangrovibacter sp. SLW1]